MPRLLLEYSSNMREHFNPGELLRELALRASDVESVDPALIKARAASPEIAWIDPRLLENQKEKGYLFVMFEWLEGRSEPIQKAMWQALKEPLERVKAELGDKIELSITLEISSIRRAEHVAF